jgi:mannose-6-phosphate isomerase
VTRLLALPDPERAALVTEVASACRGRPGAEYEVVADLADRYPGDVGAVLALLLNHVRLRPGEALFVGPGTPHAYLCGVGIEIMACSDNVLRGGLTPKHVDVGELLRVLRFEAGPVTPVPAVPDGPGICTWRAPVPEFALSRIVLDHAVPAVSTTAGGPAIVFCLSGRVHATDGFDELDLAGGQAAFVPAGRSLSVSGTGLLFRATTGFP